jgi:hypothetical protein
MLVAFSTHEETLRRITAVVPREEGVHATADWHSFAIRAPLGSCRVIGIQSGDGSVPQSADLAAARLEPLILVTPRTNDCRPLVRAVVPTDVVWSSDIERELWTKVRLATTSSTLARVADCFRRATQLPPALREALALACSATRPVASVAELGALIGRDRRTIWRQWSQSRQANDALRIEDVLHWLILLRAVLQKDRHTSWRLVARSLDVHEHTLARSAQTLVGTTLGCLTFQGPHQVKAAFVDRVMTTVGGEGAWDILR